MRHIPAHARWFVEDPRRLEPDWAFLADPTTLAFVALAGALAALALAGAGALGRAPAVRPRAAWPTRLLAVAIGISLVVLSIEGRLVLPSVPLPGGPAAVPLAVAQAITGAWLVAGLAPRVGAAGFGALYVAAAVTGGPFLPAESAYLPASAVCIAMPRRRTSGRMLAVALGASLVTAAFTEKLLAPDVTLEVLETHPALDPLAIVGLPLPEPTFVRCAGAVELALGVLLVSGLGRRPLILAAAVPFAVTVPIFGMREVLGHLPIYAALAFIAVCTPAVRVPRGRRISGRAARS